MDDIWSFGTFGSVFFYNTQQLKLVNVMGVNKIIFMQYFGLFEYFLQWVPKILDLCVIQNFRLFFNYFFFYQHVHHDFVLCTFLFLFHLMCIKECRIFVYAINLCFGFGFSCDCMICMFSEFSSSSMQNLIKSGLDINLVLDCESLAT